MSIIAFDSHKHYTFARVEGKNGENPKEFRIEHKRGNITSFLSRQQSGSSVAVETVGNWYWIIDEIEQAGMEPHLVHARKAKMMFGCINKTDKLDAKGLNVLQRAGTLPTVWIPPGEVRDKRELPRTRMVFSGQRTRLKNRIHSVIDKHGLQDSFKDISDIFGRKGMKIMASVLGQLPSNTCYTTELLLEQLDQTERTIKAIETRMIKLFNETDQHRLLKTMPGIGFILSVVILQEIGDCIIFRRYSESARQRRQGSLRQSSF
jgi:transposase